MHDLESLTCVSAPSLLQTVILCEPINLALNVPAAATDWTAIVSAGGIGVIGALLGSAVGAWMAINHSSRVRAEDQMRHLRERVAELIFRLDGVRRSVVRYYDDPQTGRRAMTGLTEGRRATDITVLKAGADVLREAQSARDDAAAVLGYLRLIAPEKISDLATKAATRAGELESLAHNDFLESDYTTRLSAFLAARADLEHEIAPARPKP